ncbi:MAG: hypothetical protein ACPHRO_11280, partial [Nannocystaceae bacterium]
MQRQPHRVTAKLLRWRLRPARAWGFTSGLATAACLFATPAHANPGQATRLSGAEAQGPATRSVSALHHNPALLTQLPGINVLSSMTAGAEVVRARQYPTDDAGLPTGALGEGTTLTQPAFGYFVGASFMLDPVAVGVGVYSLGNTYRPRSAAPFRYHLANDPNFGCGLDSSEQCPSPHFGGSAETRTDWTLAIA